MKTTGKPRLAKRALIYTRVSTEEQALQGYSLDYQKETLEHHCQQNGIEIVKHFEDDGYSAKSFDKRPAFADLCEYIKTKPKAVDYVYVIRWDRFSRNVEEAYVEIHRLRQLGVEIRCLEETVAPTDPMFPLIRAFKIAEGETDNRRRALNTKTGIVNARKEGRYTGPAPRGYERERTVGGKSIIVPGKFASLIREAFEVVALGIYSIDDVRRTLIAKGLKIGRSAFYDLLRNPTYMGLTKVPQFLDEDEYYVSGTHEPIVSEELFHQVQGVLRKIWEKSHAQCKKSKQREEFPLRGMLVCPECSRNLTGSRSRSRNGNYYHYYHCQRECKARFNVDELHEILDDHLKSLTIPAEVTELYLAVLEDTFKSQEGDREKQIQGLREQIAGCNDKMLRCDEMRIEGEIPKDSHQRLMSKYKEELAVFKKKIDVLQSGETNFIKYCRYGIPLMGNLHGFYNQASVAIKQKLLGSIFPVKLHFRNGDYRTTPINPALALILQKDNDLENKKTGQNLFMKTLSGQVPMTGLEPAPCCQE